MRIVYGINGDGLGHVTRGSVVVAHLLARGHQVAVLASGRALPFLRAQFADDARLRLHGIEGITLCYRGNRLDLTATFARNLLRAPLLGLRNLTALWALRQEGFRADAVLSDFETLSAAYALAHRLPLISVDNNQMLHRCRHGDGIFDGGWLASRIARLAVLLRVPWASHYLVTSFFFPPVARPRTTLLPPILRPAILAARREPGEHVVVYQTAATNRALLDALRALPHRFRIYGLAGEGDDGNLSLRPADAVRFVEDLRTARALITAGGFSLLSEAVHLGVPTLAIPVEGQAEQLMNGRYLAQLGYGLCLPRFAHEPVAQFLANSDGFAQALQLYARQDNARLFDSLDELLRNLR